MSNQSGRSADGHQSAVSTYSRRTFVRFAAAAAGGSALAGRANTATAPSRWFGTSGWNGFRSALRTDGGYLVTGIATNVDDEQVGWALRMDDDLEAVWERTYQSPPHLTETDVGEDHDGFEFALPDGAGGFLLVGWWHTLSSDSRYGWLVRVDGRGWPRWSRTYNRPDVNSFRDDFAGGVRTEDGYLLVGRTLGGEFLDEETGDGWVVSFDDAGRVDWQRAYNTQGAPRDDFSDDDRHAEFSAVVTAGDGYLVVGEASPDGPTDSTNTAGWAVRLDEDGDVRWTRTHRLDATTNNEFRDVVATDDGYVFAGTAGEEDNVRPLHDYQMRGRGWVLGVDERGRAQWEDDGGDAFHTVSPSARGTLLAGVRNGQGWAVEYDDSGSRTGRETTESAADSEYAGSARTASGHLLVGHGENQGDVDGLLAESTDGDGDDGDFEHVLEIVATEDGDVDYEFTVDGTVEGIRIDDRIKAEDNDDIIENDDGTVTVDGFTGNEGFGDAFRFTGAVTDFRRTEGDADFFVRLDGERVTVDELVDGDGDGDSEESRLFEIVATEDGDVEYELVVDGTVEGVRLNDRIKAEDNDHIVENDDGTVTVDGFTGNEGFGDAFRFTGDVVSFERTGGDAAFVLRVNRQRVTADELVDGNGDDAETRILEVVATESGDVEYRFTVDGTVEGIRLSDRVKAEDNDTITSSDGTTIVSGYTGNRGYGDAFRLTGPVTDFERTGGDADFFVRLDGERVTVDELVD